MKVKKNTNPTTLKHVHARQGNLYYEKSRKSFNQQKYPEALGLIDKALEHHINKEKLYLKANIYIQLLDPQKAGGVYQHILEKDPQDREANTFMSQYMLKN